MKKKVVGVLETPEQTVKAINKLKEKGNRTEFISIRANNEEKVKEEETATELHEEEDVAADAGKGALTGVILGAIGGLLVEGGVLLIPGVGPFIAAGPLMATLTGIVAGGAAG